MVKKRGIVWNYYNKKMLGSQVIAFCKFCNQSYIQNATRMERHMERCPKCPEDIKQQFIQVAHNKRHKINNLDNKVNKGWPKQESTIEQNITDTELDDIDEWNYKNQSYLVKTSNTVQQNIDLVMQNNERNWDNQNNIVENDTDTSSISRSWETNQNSTGNILPAGSQERTNSVHQRKSYNPRRISQWPDSPVQTFDRSPLQNKIYQEQLLEKRALRRAAELDVQRKVLELERFQWEYERDKLQSEVRWAHETRMMQLKEERERQLTEQSRTKTESHIAKRQRSLTPFSPTMSQPGNTVSGKLANVISEENYYYVGVKASPFASDSVVFGLNKAEVWALSKRFPNSGSDVVNGVMIKGPPFSIINALAELGYRVVCSTGEAEILWTLQREL